MRVWQTFLSARVGADGVSAHMCCPSVGVRGNSEDGRFFAPLRMTCFEIATNEMLRSSTGGAFAIREKRSRGAC